MSTSNPSPHIQATIPHVFLLNTAVMYNIKFHKLIGNIENPTVAG